MREWAATLDAMCVSINPVLMLVAVVVALLNLVAATHQWIAAHPASALSVEPVAGTVSPERCAAPLAPELRDLMGYD